MSRAGPEKLLASEQLLFGIIALQSDFLTREQFVAGFDAWVHDKSRTLAAILESHGGPGGRRPGGLGTARWEFP